MSKPARQKATHVPVGAEGVVQVFEYRCTLERGAPVQPEQFTRTAISVVTAGVFGFRSGSDNQLLSRASALLATPGQQYEISHEHMGGDRCLIFRFEDGALEDASLEHGRPAGQGPFARSVLPPVTRVDAIRQLAERHLAQRGASLGLEELGLTLAACVFEHAAANPRRVPLSVQTTRRTRENIFLALAHLERTATEDIRLADLATLAGLSPFHFLRLFKREMGMTPHQHLVKARIRRALSLLRDTSIPVTEIALEVGFGDLSNFIHTFRREVGCSPSQFRRARPSEWAASVRALIRAKGPSRQRAVTR